MEFFFGKRKTPEQMMREDQRSLNKTVRELEREKVRLENEERKVIIDIKKLAKQGQMDAVKIMAKDLVRTRNHVKKFILMKANIQAVSLKIQISRSTNAMAQAMKGVTRTMQRMNKSMNLPQLQKIMMELERESNIVEMKEEMMTDTIDDALGEEGDEEQSEKLVQQVLDELGLELTDDLLNICPFKDSFGFRNTNPPAAANNTLLIDRLPSPPSNSFDDDLEARFKRFRQN